MTALALTAGALTIAAIAFTLGWLGYGEGWDAGYWVRVRDEERVG